MQVIKQRELIWSQPSPITRGFDDKDLPLVSDWQLITALRIGPHDIESIRNLDIRHWQFAGVFSAISIDVMKDGSFRNLRFYRFARADNRGRCGRRSYLGSRFLRRHVN
jgi:hypothetical protein